MLIIKRIEKTLSIPFMLIKKYKDNEYFREKALLP